MDDLSELENLSSDLSGRNSDNDMKMRARRSDPNFRNAVDKTMLPRNFKSLTTFFRSSEKSAASELRNPSSLSASREASEALRGFREIAYVKFGKTVSSEEESHYSKDSYVDSEDSGLIKEGYEFERKSQPISRDKLDRKVYKWKRTASKHMEEINKLYKPRRSKQKEMFSVPLGLEANQRVSAEPQPTDSSSKSQSRLSSQCNTEDEIDIRRNDEFMREVHRVLRAKKNPQTLEKISLPEEYSRLIFKKTGLVRNRNWQTKILALTEKEEAESQNTDTGAEGDYNSELVTGIFDQLSKMVLKNKVSTNSKTTQKRKKLQRRIEEKRCTGNSDMDEGASKTGKEPQPGSSAERQITYDDWDQENSQHSNNALNRLKKVESYLSSVPDAQSISTALPEIDNLTSENEQSLFDSFAGVFLKNLTTGNESRNKITRNDRNLLAIIVKRYVVRGEVSRIDELMNSNLRESIEVPPYENVFEREEFFLKKIVKKFLSRGMRNDLEDLIAWIYYKLDAKNAKVSPMKIEKILNEDEVRNMVNAFKNSGKNASLDRIVSQLLREHKKENPGLNGRQIAAVKDMIKGLLIERFARMYLGRTALDVDRHSEPCTLAVNVVNKVGMNSGLERLDVNGRKIEIKWKFASTNGETEQAQVVNTEHETEEDPSAEEKPSLKAIESECTGVISQEFEKDVNFVKRGLEDIVWNVQQSYQRLKSGKANRTCSVVKKRSTTMIGEPNKGGKFSSSEAKNKVKKLDPEERRKQMRKEHVKWLLEQKEMLKEAKKKEAMNIERFTEALPNKLENIIARHDRSLKQLNQRGTVDMPKRRMQ